MAQLTVVYWRDIPAKVQLTERFEKAIDRAAMRANLRDTDSYLAEWRRASPVEVGDALQTEADKKAAELEASFDEAKLKTLVESGGLEAK
jgi:Virulence factor